MTDSTRLATAKDFTRADILEALNTVKPSGFSVSGHPKDTLWQILAIFEKQDMSNILDHLTTKRFSL